jgi:hypothetical protein
VHARDDSEHGVLRVAAELHAEAAAHLGGDHAHEVLRQREQGGEVVAEVVGGLVSRPRHDPAREGIRRGHEGSWLDGHATQPLVDHALLDHAVGTLEGRLGVAGLDLLDVLDVPVGVVVQLGRSVLHGREHVVDHGERLPVHHDLGGRVGRDRLRRRHHRGHGLAHVTHAPDREWIVLAADGYGVTAALSSAPER